MAEKLRKRYRLENAVFLLKKAVSLQGLSGPGPSLVSTNGLPRSYHQQTSLCAEICIISSVFDLYLPVTCRKISEPGSFLLSAFIEPLCRSEGPTHEPKKIYKHCSHCHLASCDGIEEILAQSRSSTRIMVSIRSILVTGAFGSITYCTDDLLR